MNDEVSKTIPPRTHSLTLHIFQTANDAVAPLGWTEVHFVLRNDGSEVLASSTDEIEVKVDFEHVDGRVITRTFRQTAVVGSGASITGPGIGSTGAGSSFTLTITSNIAAGGKAEFKTQIENDIYVWPPGGAVHRAVVTVDSFGENDNVTAQTYKTLAELGLISAQQSVCQSEYDALVQEKVESVVVPTTLKAEGPTVMNGNLFTQTYDWAVGDSISSDDIRNFLPGLGITLGPSSDGKW